MSLRTSLCNQRCLDRIACQVDPWTKNTVLGRLEAITFNFLGTSPMGPVVEDITLGATVTRVFILTVMECLFKISLESEGMVRNLSVVVLTLHVELERLGAEYCAQQGLTAGGASPRNWNYHLHSALGLRR